MTFTFTRAGNAIANQTFGDLDNIDLRVALVMSGNNAVTQRASAVFMGDLTLDEFDGGGYSRQALASETLTLDTGNFRTELTASANVWDPLSAGTDDVVGAIIYKHVTNDADSPVLAYYDDGNFPASPNGGPFTITWSSEGLLQVDCPLS